MHYPFEKILQILRRRLATDRLKNRLFRLMGINSRYLLILILCESIWYLPSTLRWILLAPFWPMASFWYGSGIIGWTEISIKSRKKTHG